MEDSGHERRVQTICLVILTGVAIAVALHWLKAVLIPVVIAAFIAIGLTPLVDVQVRRLKMPHALAVVTSLLAGLLIVLMMAAVMSASVAQIGADTDATEAPASQPGAMTYKGRAQELLEQTVEVLHLEKIGLDSDAIVAGAVSVLQKGLLGTTTVVLDILGQSTLVLIFVCFMLFGARPKTSGPSKVEGSIRRYITTKVFLSAVTGVLVGFILWMLDVDLALGFGLMAFMLNFIPSIGSIIATLLPLPMVLLDPSGTITQAVLAIALPGAVQFTLGNVIEPRMMGKSFGLHPVAILMALIFWSVLWGMPGMFLATPLTAIAKILLARNEFTAPAARILEGRFELSEAG